MLIFVFVGTPSQVHVPVVVTVEWRAVRLRRLRFQIFGVTGGTSNRQIQKVDNYQLRTPARGERERGNTF